MASQRLVLNPSSLSKTRMHFQDLVFERDYFIQTRQDTTLVSTKNGLV